jgi:hypothetical protein
MIINHSNVTSSYEEWQEKTKSKSLKNKQIIFNNHLFDFSDNGELFCRNLTKNVKHFMLLPNFSHQDKIYYSIKEKFNSIDEVLDYTYNNEIALFKIFKQNLINTEDGTSYNRYALDHVNLTTVF